MATEVKLPELAEGVTQGDVVSIMVKEGDTVNAEDTILEVEAGKATVSVPSPSKGKVTKVLVKQGEKVSVGQVVIELDSGDAAPAAPAKKDAKAAKTDKPAAEPKAAAPKAAAKSPAPPATPAAVSDVPAPLPSNTIVHEDADTIPAGPAVRRIARELGIDLRVVAGSGRNGRILVEDLDPYIRQYMAGRAGGGGGASLPSIDLPDFSKYGTIRREKISSLRRKIAHHLHASWVNIPHVHHNHEADITDLFGVQKRYKDKVKEKGGQLTLTPFLLKAIVITLKEFPAFNASFDAANNEVIFKEFYNVGVAVDTREGLIVPVVRDVDSKSVVDLAIELNTLAERTRTRKVGLDELQGGTFTLSNLGGIGGGHFNPIINAPEVAILGVGRAKKALALREDGTVTSRMMLPITLAYDHRVIDGADGARFIVRLAEILENYEGTFLGL